MLLVFLNLALRGSADRKTAEIRPVHCNWIVLVDSSCVMKIIAISIPAIAEMQVIHVLQIFLGHGFVHVNDDLFKNKINHGLAQFLVVEVMVCVSAFEQIIL